MKEHYQKNNWCSVDDNIIIINTDTHEYWLENDSFYSELYNYANINSDKSTVIMKLTGDIKNQEHVRGKLYTIIPKLVFGKPEIIIIEMTPVIAVNIISEPELMNPWQLLATKEQLIINESLEPVIVVDNSVITIDPLSEEFQDILASGFETIEMTPIVEPKYFELIVEDKLEVITDFVPVMDIHPDLTEDIAEFQSTLRKINKKRNKK